MKKTIALVVSALFAMSAVAFANESAQGQSQVVVQKSKKAKKTKKGAKKEKAAEGHGEAAPAEGAAH
jgi:uncharacterized protein YxeA